MIESERLVYLQLRKTGCTYIETILQQLIPCKKIGKHNALPPNYPLQNKIIAISIRNPWDWYVSLWAFGCTHPNSYLVSKVSKRKLTGHGIKDSVIFGFLSILNEISKPIKTWQKVYSDHTNPVLFKEWLLLVLSQSRKYDLGLSYGFNSLSSFVGYLTFQYLQLGIRDFKKTYKTEIIDFDSLRELDRKQNIINAVIRMESINDDLIQTLSLAGYTLNNDQLDLINSYDRVNKSSRERHLSFYYDNELIDIVQERERFFIEKYGYSPPLKQQTIYC